MATPRINRRGAIPSALVDTPKRPRKSCRIAEVCEPLVGREKEIQFMEDVIAEHMKSETSGSLYISGTPGTGKTACVDYVFRKHKGKKCLINCFAVEDCRTIYSQIWSELRGGNDGGLPLTPSRNQRELLKLEGMLQEERDIKLIVLDEIDQLRTKDSTLLDRIFGWPTLPKFHVIVIGVSNGLDLTTKLSLRSAVKTPKKLHFTPYSAEQVTAITAKSIHKEGISVHPTAVALCSKRVANRSGDIRMAFSIVKRSVIAAESPSKKLNRSEGSENEPADVPPVDNGVKISHVQAVMSEQSSTKTLSTLPTQQRILICCGLLLSKAKKPITVGALDSKYSEIRSSQGLPPLSQTDVVHFCELLASLGVFSLKKNSKNVRLSSVSFKSEEEAEFNVVGKPMMDSILNGTIGGGI
ncbi:putative Cell division control protein 6-like protein [Hypsibius exemplaris]|uniref:Cell division control protein 6-like protein n=1 Tax=Hypsibius exemplaris TaxID=2072580 RepID=A0A1W0WRJ3_HYPEX|nr:putative Cell division control protein 6-like protein [Hypsibius exemplaris]